MGELWCPKFEAIKLKSCALKPNKKILLRKMAEVVAAK